MSIYDESIEYHSSGRKGKIEVVPSKPVATQHDLSLAYSPGVAEPCRKIAEDVDLAYEYTAKGNLVAVITNGSAVLGLGNLGPDGAKPVMEGKGVLFKKFADIDVFDIEVASKTPDEFIKACEMLEPTFGGMNLEDIKSPECFYIEETLREKLNIPVFHDDQHGTAVISAAAFINAVEVVGKDISKMKVVVSGGGAAAIACTSLYISLGLKKENVIMTDSHGIIYKGRKEGMNPYKERFAIDTKMRTLDEALKGADAFIGCSVGGTVSKEMVKSMAKDPIIFAMANPEPEIHPQEVFEVRDDAIMATGRSDYPNQVNNVLGFPFIFRGALDTRSRAINEEMKMAAVRALADLAKQDVTEAVSRAYGGEKFKFGKNYLIPKPFDRRALLWIAPAVAEAAMKSGVSRIKLDLREYRQNLEKLLGSTYTVMRGFKNRVIESGEQSAPPKVVLPEGDHRKVLRACKTILEEGILQPILLGKEERVRNQIKELDLVNELKDVQIIQPSLSPDLEKFATKLFEKRKRKGVSMALATNLMKQPNYFASMMVELGMADGLLGGVSQSYPETIRPALDVIGAKKGSRVAGIYMVVTKKNVFWFADTTVNIDPSANELADIAIQTANLAKTFVEGEIRVAMLSFSNFGSNRHPFALKVARAVEIVRNREPELKIDGEMQADVALEPSLSAESFTFNDVPGNANVLVFPDLQSGNIAYKMMQRMGGAEVVGPILTGMARPVHVLQRGSAINDIVNMATITAMEIQSLKK